MLHNNNPIINHKASLLNLAEVLKNVTKACKIMGVSRDIVYRYQALVEDGDINLLINQSKHIPNLKNRTDEVTELAVTEYAVEFPAHGQHRQMVNGICERFHKTILQAFYQVTFRKMLYGEPESLQKELDIWLSYYNNERTHQGKVCCGRTPIETLDGGKRVWSEKNLNQM